MGLKDVQVIETISSCFKKVSNETSPIQLHWNQMMPSFMHNFMHAFNPVNAHEAYLSSQSCACASLNFSRNIRKTYVIMHLCLTPNERQTH